MRVSLQSMLYGELFIFTSNQKILLFKFSQSVVIYFLTKQWYLSGTKLSKYTFQKKYQVVKQLLKKLRHLLDGFQN